MSSPTEQLTNAINEAEAAAMVMASKAEAVINICRKARKRLAAKVVSTSLKDQSKVIRMKVADALSKREKKMIK